MYHPEWTVDSGDPMNLSHAVDLLKSSYGEKTWETGERYVDYVLSLVERVQTEEEKIAMILYHLLIHQGIVRPEPDWDLEMIEELVFPKASVECLWSLAGDDLCKFSEEVRVREIARNAVATKVKIAKLAQKLDVPIEFSIAQVEGAKKEYESQASLVPEDRRFDSENIELFERVEHYEHLLTLMKADAKRAR